MGAWLEWKYGNRGEHVSRILTDLPETKAAGSRGQVHSTRRRMNLTRETVNAIAHGIHCPPDETHAIARDMNLIHGHMNPIAPDMNLTLRTVNAIARDLHLMQGTVNA